MQIYANIFTNSGGLTGATESSTRRSWKWDRLVVQNFERTDGQKARSSKSDGATLAGSKVRRRGTVRSQLIWRLALSHSKPRLSVLKHY